ncbi:MAG: BON domain-containing protein [Planctomycetota bacterium]
MKARLSLLLLLVGCASGYRTEEDSKELRRELDDSTIESRVRMALASDPETTDEPLEVTVVDGVVHLRGAVSRDPAAARAITLAREVDGVAKVADRITRPGASASR